MEAVYIVLVIAALGGMWWFAYRMEPHWASKDGRTFMCNAQEMLGHQPVGRRQETRVAIMPDGALHVTQKHLMRRRSSTWTLVGKAPDPPKKLQIYLARQHRDGQPVPATAPPRRSSLRGLQRPTGRAGGPPSASTARTAAERALQALPAELALRVPTKSRSIQPLDAALAANRELLEAARAELRASRPGPGTAAEVEPPDPG